MRLHTAPYSEQLKAWPPSGRHIMAQYDESTLVVYQAYRRSIAQYAVAHQRFGGEFGFGRMSWIKPNFLWMMFRCGWATKENQECVLAVRIRRDAFDRILGGAVHSTFGASRHPSQEARARALRSSEVRLQWDPDHGPSGNRVERRALQLGLSGEVLHKYATEWIVDIEDITDFVREQHASAIESNGDRLAVPVERPYYPSKAIAERIGLDAVGEPTTGPGAP